MEEKYGISTKKFMFEELKEKFSAAPDFIITNYKGLSSSQIEKLRKVLNKSSSEYFVVKNSIVKRLLGQRNMGDLEAFIKGEVGIGFIGDDPIAASKTLVDFSKENSALKLNCAFIDGKIEDADRIKYFATVPSREVLLALALSYMKSPITGFVGVLRGLLRNLVYVITEIKNKRMTNDKAQA